MTSSAGADLGCLRAEKSWPAGLTGRFLHGGRGGPAECCVWSNGYR